MSKAFTSEDTPELGAVAREPPRVRPGEVRYVTPEGQEALHSELERLRSERRAAAHLSGSDAAAQIANLDRRISLVEGTLAVLTVLDPEDAPQGIVAFGTWVTVDDEEGRRHTWRIVGPDEADPRRQLVSVHSPVGRALLGRAAGDVVEIERPDGRREYAIVDVRRTAP